MTRAAGLALADDLWRAFQVQEPSVAGQWRRSWSRYLRLRAEQLITPPASQWRASHSPIASSHGYRSSSSSGSPAVILAMLAGG